MFARIFVVVIKFWSRCGEREGDDDWMKVMSVDCTTHPNSVREMCVVYGAAVSSLSLKFSWALLVFWLNYIPSLSLFFFLSLSLFLFTRIMIAARIFERTSRLQVSRSDLRASTDTLLLLLLLLPVSILVFSWTIFSFCYFCFPLNKKCCFWFRGFFSMPLTKLPPDSDWNCWTKLNKADICWKTL